MAMIEYSTDGAVATIRLNRPDKLNSFTMTMATEMKEALNNCTSDDIRAVVITGNGRAFCAGQDLAEAISKQEDPEFELSEIVEFTYKPIVLAIRNLEKPVIAAVNGTAAGAGANIAFACDIAIAAKSAKFIQSFSQIGLIPDSGGTWTLPRLIGAQRAAYLMMTGDKVSADEAWNMGMIAKVVADDALELEVSSLAKKLAAMPTKGFALTKKALQNSSITSFEEQLEVESKLQAIAGNTFDYNEGVQAFLQKRKPEFRGR